MNYSLLLKYIRETRGLKQEQLADVLGCSRSRLSRIESERLDLYTNEWLELVSFLGKSPIFEGDRFHLGDESFLLSKSTLEFGVISKPLGPIFYQVLSKASKKGFNDIAKEIGISEHYFANLSNGLPGRFFILALQKLCAQEGENLRGPRKQELVESFVSLLFEYRAIEAERFQNAVAQHRVEMLLEQLEVNSHLDLNLLTGRGDSFTIEGACTSPLSKLIFFQDPLFRTVCESWLILMIEYILEGIFSIELNYNNVAFSFKIRGVKKG